MERPTYLRARKGVTALAQRVLSPEDWAKLKQRTGETIY